MVAGRKEGRGRNGRVYRYLFLASLAGERVFGGGVVTRVEGEDKVKGGGMHPYPQQARPKIPSSLNGPKKVTIATLCTLWTDTELTYCSSQNKVKVKVRNSNFAFLFNESTISIIFPYYCPKSKRGTI
jgi:hypothetical protein